MKHTFSYLLLIFTALMLLSVIGGISLWFESIGATWTTQQTDIVARNLSPVLWYGGIVFVSVLGLGLFNTMTKGSRRAVSQPEYQVDHQPMISNTSAPVALLPVTEQQAQWYELDQNQVVKNYQK